MTATAIIGIIVGVLGMVGGIVFNFVRLNRVLKENEYKNVINAQRADISSFRKEIRELQDKIEKMNLIIRELDISLIKTKAISLDFPFPFWYKSGQDFKMRLLNDEYCKTYRKCREDYIGKTDHEVWDKETADKFRENDLLILNSQLGYMVSVNEEMADRIIIKWRVPGLVKNEFYIAGVSVPYNILKDVGRKQI